MTTTAPRPRARARLKPLGERILERVFLHATIAEAIATTAPTAARPRARLKPLGERILERVFLHATIAEAIAAEGAKHKAGLKAFASALRKRETQPAKDYVTIQLHRLEAAANALLIKVNGGDLPSLDRYLKVLDRAERYYKFLAALGAKESELADVYKAATDSYRAKLHRQILLGPAKDAAP